MLQKVMFALLLATPVYADKVQAPMFSIDHVTPKDTQSVRLFEGGRWSGPAGSGKLSADDMKRFQTELAAAKWTVTTAKIRCMARSENFTRYYADGKLVFESHVCDGKSLDEASQKLVTDANALLAPGFEAKKP
jgi:hypothetical protein